MNMNRIDANHRSDAIKSPKAYEGVDSIGQKGQIVEGLITQVSDKVSIEFNGREVTTSLSAVRNARKGEKRLFEIKDISKNSIVLKEVGSNADKGRMIKGICTNVAKDQTVFKEHLEKSLGDKEKEKDQAKEIEDGKSKLEEIESRLSKEDYMELIKEGNLLEAYDLVRLEKALARIKDQRKTREISIEKQAKSFEKIRENVIQTANGTKDKDKTSEYIIERLEKANLPVTDSNIAKIMMAMDLITDISISDNDKYYMMKNSLTPTIENIYKAVYSSSPVYEAISDSVIDEMKVQIEKMIESEGLELTKENQENARWLIKNNLPLTKENLQQLKQLEDINISMKDGDYKEKVLDKVTDSLLEGRNPKETSLIDNSQYVEDVINVISNSEDEVILEAANSGEVITVSSLRRAYGILIKNGSRNIHMPNDTSFITAKRQLEEIRLKMTSESFLKMLHKGIEIETSDLATLVEELKEQENTYYRNLLEEGNVTQSKDHIEILKETTEKINEIKSMPNYILGSTLPDRNIVTLRTIHEKGTRLQSSLDKARESYDILMTEPRKDLGDSIKKAFQSIDTILADMELETTNENRRAVKILGYNSMEITKESINQVKSYDGKMNALLKQMHPAAVVDMIKEGVNPLDTPIFELSKKIQERNEKLGGSEEEKYSEFLWKLEKDNGITKEERKAFIGIYRLLNNIEKTDGKALGRVIKANQEVTLNHLLEAVRTEKSQGMDYSVDDNFGALESLTFSKETITNQIDAGYTSNNTTNEGEDRIKEVVEYMETILHNIQDEISPARLSSLGDGAGSLEKVLEFSLEKFYEELSSGEVNDPVSDEYIQEKLDRIREACNNPEEPIRFLDHYNIDKTINNIILAGDYLNNGNTTFKKVQKLIENPKREVEKEELDDKIDIHDSMNGLAESLVDEDTMVRQYEQLDEKLTHLLDQELKNQTITSKDIADIKNISSGMKFMKSLSRSRNYEIPLFVGDSITNINLKIISGLKESGRVDMRVSSEQLGDIEASFLVKGKEIKGVILTDNREGLNELKEGKERLAQRMKDINLSLKQLDYGSSLKGGTLNSVNENLNKEKEEVSTKQLYQVGKVLVGHIREIESRLSKEEV
mgnify:CR=1 FL=1